MTFSGANVKLPDLRTRALVAGALFATFAYVYGLDSIFAPTIGDESLYLQIARVTAASGQWLPLRWESGVNDTKPPMLFWQGIASTARGAHWDLWHLRLPVVALSLATAALAAALARRLAGSRRAALTAGLVYLGFLSTIQYGRPFLTNAGETLFLFLPLVLLAARASTSLPLALAAGASLGLAALYKSFVVVVPGTFALALVLWRREGWSVPGLLRRHGLFLLVAAVLGLAVFGLWPLLDPQRELVWWHFVYGENVGKLQGGDYLAGLLSGESSIWQIWLGDLRNAGLYAPPVLALLWDLWRRRRELPAPEAELWLYVLAFLLFYSVPSQRQPNYLLPTMPALAVLLALRWEALAGAAVRLPLVGMGVLGLAVPVLAVGLQRRLPGLEIPLATLALPVALALPSLAGAVRLPFGRAALPWLALGALVVGSAVLAPFSHPFPAAARAETRGRPVWFPDRFEQSQERYRFLLPEADVRGYPCKGGASSCDAVPGARGDHAVFYRGLGEALPAGYQVVAALPHFRGRHTDEQILEILGGRYDLLVEWMVLARPVAPAAPAP
jgi:4-amino-4-deoxy-L-arabinose transferase-like glycosyltransferase